MFYGHCCLVHQPAVVHTINWWITTFSLLFLFWKNKDVFALYIILLLCWDVTGSWNPSFGKTRICLFYMVTAMAADALVTKGARASAAMVLTYFFSYIPVSAQVVSTLTELLISQEILLAILNDIIWSTRHYKESLLFKDTTDKYNSVWSPPVKCMLMASTTALLGHLQVQWWPWPAPQGVSACSVVSQNWWSGTARLVPLPAAIPSSDETGRYARISPVAILTGSVSLRASRMSAAGFGNTRPITPHHAR